MSDLIEKENLPSHQMGNINSQEGVLVLLSLIEGLSYNVMSPAVWEFSMDDALDIATKRYGIEQESVKQMLNKILALAHEKGKTNPMSSIF